MSFAAWLMLAFAILVLGGGLTACISVAMRVDRRKREQGGRYDEEADA